ncbi:MAG: ketosteroid isomerase-like protein [Bermanella sp.]
MNLIDDNKQRVLQFFEALNAADGERIAAAYAPDGTCWTSGNTLISGVLSRDQIVAGAAAVLDVFPQGLAFTVHAMTAEGERVAVEAESKGLHVSGFEYKNSYHFLFEFRDGKLLRLKEYMDTEVITDVLCGGQRPQA